MKKLWRKIFKRKGNAFTLIELLAAIIVIVIILLIAMPQILNNIEKSKKSAFELSVKAVFDMAESDYIDNPGFSEYYFVENELRALEDQTHIVNYTGELDGTGLVFINNENKTIGKICNLKWCVEKQEEKFTLTDNVDGNSIMILTNKNELTTKENYSIYALNADPNFTSANIYISRYSEQMPLNDTRWDEGTLTTEILYGQTVDNNEPGSFYIHMKTNNNGTYVYNTTSLVNIEIDEEQRIQELAAFEPSPKASVINNIKYDFIQAYFYTEKSKAEITRDFKLLKRAGYEGIVFQMSATTRGGTSEADPMYIKDIWHDTSLTSYVTEDTNVYHGVLDTIMEVAEEEGLMVYLGTVENSEWYQSVDITKTNDYWRAETSTFINALIAELYSRYSSSPVFKGFYYTYEMYTNNIDMLSAFSELLNNFVNGVHSVNANTQILTGAFISSAIYEYPEDTQTNFTTLIQNSPLKDGDIFLIQDGLGFAKYSVEEVYDYLLAFKAAVASSSADLKLGVIMENFGNTEDGTAPVERVIEQMKIADLLDPYMFFSFSYVHNYNMYSKGDNDEFLSRNYDIEYRKFIGYPVDIFEDVTGIETPPNGYVYLDINRDEAPIPEGFTVDEENNVIDDGLVIRDEYGNEFVWVPTNLGVKPNNYEYENYEWDRVGYTRYLENGVTPLQVESDVMPDDVANEEDQINKYFGFYVGRYEASYDYNGGNYRVMVKPGANAVELFYWNFANSEIYTGNMWNNVQYQYAKSNSENMDESYNYSNVKVGLINGKQWDSILKWINISDPNFMEIYNSRYWGNYIDAASPANLGNYSSGVFKLTGSNENWKRKNIYDLAGNLKEWTAEKYDATKRVIRTESYKGSGFAGSASYGLQSESYNFNDVGFRVVLYLD